VVASAVVSPLVVNARSVSQCEQLTTWCTREVGCFLTGGKTYAFATFCVRDVEVCSHIMRVVPMQGWTDENTAAGQLSPRAFARYHAEGRVPAKDETGKAYCEPSPLPQGVFQYDYLVQRRTSGGASSCSLGIRMVASQHLLAAFTCDHVSFRFSTAVLLVGFCTAEQLIHPCS
jgi:hypothetical protein